jgi:TPR repeat protein
MQLIFGPAVSRENTSRTDTVTDFRVERLRRMLKNGWTPAALTLAEEYAASGLSEAQYLLAQMLASTGRPEDTEAAKRWYEAAAQIHRQQCGSKS